MIKLEVLVDEKGKCEECSRRFEAVSYRVSICGVVVKVCDGCAVELREVMADAG